MKATAVEQEPISYRYLLWFSLPSIAASLLEPLASIVDSALVGQRDTLWLAAMAVAVTILSSFTWMFNFLLHVSTQSVSKREALRKIGKSDYHEVAAEVRICLQASLITGLAASVVLYFLAPFLFYLAGLSDQLKEYCYQYFYIRLLGHPLFIVYLTAISLLRGLGRVYLGLILIFISTGVNILLTWLGLFVFSAGLGWVAWATVISCALGLLLALVFIAHIDRAFFETIFSWKIFHRFSDSAKWNQFSRNSIHLFGRSLFLTLSLFLAMRGAKSLGADSLAAHYIMLQAWLFASFFIDGFAISANILVARFYASEKWKELARSCQKLVVLSLLVGVLFTLSYAFFSSFLTSLFTQDPQVLTILFSLWFLLVISQIPNAYAFILDGLLFGLGQFSYLRKHMMIGVTLIFLPLLVLALYTQQLQWIWGAMVMLSCYRAISGQWQVSRLNRLPLLSFKKRHIL